jgi:hypothetical protein
VDFRVTPPAQRDRDLVCSRLGRSSVPVREVVFLDERAAVVVCDAALRQPAPPTGSAVRRRPVVWTVAPLRVRVGGDTGVVGGAALGGESGVVAGPFQRVPTPAVVGQVVTPPGVVVRVVDADRGAVGGLLHTSPH